MQRQATVGRSGMARWAEGGAGGGNYGDLDRMGTGPAHGPGGAGEGMAGGGDVVDHQDPAGGEAAPAAGRRSISDPDHRATSAIGFVGIAAGATKVPTGRGSEQGDQGHVERGGDARGGLVGVVPRQAARRAGRDPGDQVDADPGRHQRGPEATAERVQGGRLPAELAGDDRRPQGVAVGPERPQRHARVGRQSPRSRSRRLGR
jgi:hypothetical protein